MGIAGISLMFVFSNWDHRLYGLSWVLLLLLFLAVCTEIVMLYKVNKIKASRIVSDKLSNSDLNEVIIKLYNNHNFTSHWELIDEVPIQFQKRDFLMNVSIPGNSTKTINYQLRPVERGLYYFGSLNCFISTKIGLIKRRYTFDQNQEVKTYPSFIQMKKYDFLAITNKLNMPGLKKIRRLGHTMEFEQINTYVIGDDIRSINWKATAKKGHIMVNQYQDEKMQPIYAIIDASRVMKMPFDGLKLLDYAINATLSFANIALKKGDKVGLVAFSNTMHTFYLAQAKKSFLSTINEALYAIDTNYLDADFGLLQALVKRNISQRSLLLLFSNFEHISSLRRQLPYLKAIAKNHVLVVIFFENTELKTLTDLKANTIPEIYDQTIAQQFAIDKKWMVKELQQLGIQTLLTTPEKLTINTINKYLEIKSRGLL